MTNVDTTELAARMRRSITRLNRKLRQSSLGGLSPAQASMLATIEKLGSPALGELALQEQIQPPSVTRIVQTLDGAGLVELRDDPNDRRSTRATLTAKGRHEVTTIRQRKTAFLDEQLRRLSDADLKRAGQMADLLEALLEDS
jgi:DNA-binding MarR family transcriptional regulator